ncbi:MAG: hypothetical protein OMM_07318 [Candidatus Magnetoglobus multicellularis str. Araruama]|uniref:Uncharacterized protein n=1 Tax=Candidatus Magnetoglobus multicellularis str. Araruama TaxID=890399 RepID=A0A1V1PDC6_9BACT|nr:MAG: hypothetical protein OMM_07318 [Candidatus Magnetoglobus multicellularis str. Araruama]
MPNPSRFKFSRNKSNSVLSRDKNTLCSIQTVIDTFYQMNVKVSVKMPDMEIMTIEANVDRSINPMEFHAIGELEKLKGIRIGPGMKKIIKGTVASEYSDSLLIFMVVEACQGVILTMTREMATQIPDHQDLDIQIFRDMVKANPRLYNRCAAYSDGSPLVAGLKGSSK